jgi:hypothetical protein
MALVVEVISNNPGRDAEVRRIGEYATIPEAIAVAQKIVDDFLQRTVKPGLDGESLYTLYRTRGDHPFIFRDNDTTTSVPGFNQAQYAMARATELCGGKG